MTPRQAYNIIIWFILLPITIGIWIQFLPPCAFGCIRVQDAPEPKPPAYVPGKRYYICSYGGKCWTAEGPDSDVPLEIQKAALSPPPPEPGATRRYTICAIAGAENCWVVEGR